MIYMIYLINMIVKIKVLTS